MKKVSLSGSKRKSVGKKDAKLLRREGQIPAVLYGNKEQVHFSVDEIALKKLVYTPNVYIFELDIDGTKVPAVMKEVQIHPVTDRTVHVDFQEVVDGKPVKIEIPIKLTGLSEGVKSGGKLMQHFRKLKVEALVENLPDTVEIDITEVGIGDKIRVGDVDINGVKLLNPESAVIIAVQMARGAKKTVEEEAAEEAEA